MWKLRGNYNLFNNKIKEIINNLNDLIDIIDTYYKINNNILNNYSKQNRNYEILANFREINLNNEIFKDLENINKMNNIKQQKKKIRVLVQIAEEGNTNVQVISQSNNIICPRCHEPCRIKIENYQIKLFECINNHSKNIKLKDFPNTQRINISEIICEKCRIKNKGNCPNNEFYKCLTCNQNLCLLCRAKHDLNHDIINYDKKYYLCQDLNDLL